MVYRRKMKISWTEHTTNEEVLRKTGAERSLIKTCRKRQLFLGHIMRKERLENLSLTGCNEGKKILKYCVYTNLLHRIDVAFLMFYQQN